MNGGFYSWCFLLSLHSYHVRTLHKRKSFFNNYDIYIKLLWNDRQCDNSHQKYHSCDIVQGLYVHNLSFWYVNLHLPQCRQYHAGFLEQFAKGSYRNNVLKNQAFGYHVWIDPNVQVEMYTYTHCYVSVCYCALVGVLENVRLHAAKCLTGTLTFNWILSYREQSESNWNIRLEKYFLIQWHWQIQQQRT